MMTSKLFTVNGQDTNNLVVASLGATTNSPQGRIAGRADAKTFLRLDVADGGSFTWGSATLKINARIIGSDNSTTYTAYLAIQNLTSTGAGPNIAGGTGITAFGLYEIDISGYEVLVEFTKGTASGTLSVRAQTVEWD